MNNIWLAFLTGLTTGGFTCLAVQGGLLASSVTQTANADSKTKARYVGAFLFAKIIVYTTLGVLLGLLGSKLIISPQLQGLMQIFAGFFLLATAARLLELHPVFRYFVIQPPRFALKLARNASRASLFAPGFLGASTILIPCGVTQAMMVLAVSTQNPLLGASIMAAFIIGTSPVFFALGMTANELLKRKALGYVAVGVIAILGIQSINAGQALRGSVHILQNYYKAATGQLDKEIYAQGRVAGVTSEGKQQATINVKKYGYSSNITTLKAGVPVKLNLVTENANGCTRAFRIPALGVSKLLPVNGSETVEFIPKTAGKLVFTCSMGMFTGSFEVI